MKDDSKLIERCGKENPFKTPEGYFEHFSERLMSNLPQTEAPVAQPANISLFTRIKPWLYMAAVFVSTIFVVQALMFVQETKFPSQAMAFEDIYAEEADLFMATSLYNEYTLYSYLTTYEND